MVTDEIKMALQVLRVKGSVTVIKNDSFTVKVLVNGKEFGIWDTIKKTFVE